MRINVYSEELSNRIVVIHKQVEGRDLVGIRFHLYLPVTVDGEQIQGPFLHKPGDDDSSAVTFWGDYDQLQLLFRMARSLMAEDQYTRSVEKQPDKDNR